MTVGKLIGLIPEDIFQELSVKTGVDTQVKKLSGELIFKLILFSMLNADRSSLRVMEQYLHSGQFKLFTGYGILEGKYNSIRDRICTIEATYFEQLFERLFLIYNKELDEQKSLARADSTMVGLSAKLFKVGMEYNDNVNRFVKFSINLKGSLPSAIKIYTDKKYASENLALSEVIECDDSLQGNIVVFDRGLQARDSFDKFTDSDKMFVARHNSNIVCVDVTETKVRPAPAGANVTVISDKLGRLLNRRGKKTKHIYRVIRATVNKTGEDICFVTSIRNEDAYVIADLYRLRWEIELFFKFIKQYLNASHLVSRDLNGIKVMIYMTMIVAMLLIVYRKRNGLKGFKIPKLRFELELDTEIMKEIVVLCGGNPEMAPHIFKSG
ncbi:IS4 family transposase [Niabella hirudinis]|uniref:IS4 family transposase n=1 Tax=Niabella hirudinis TaxID=1285929 RepID=UPI003EBEE74E